MSVSQGYREGCVVGERGLTCTRKTLRSEPPVGSAIRFDIPFPQYVASFSKSVFVSGSVRGLILCVCKLCEDC
jgi:hypothetical protein